MTLLGFVAVGAASPEGMANTSHQTRFCCGGDGSHDRHVSGLFGSSTHWRGSVFGAGARTYLGTATVLFCEFRTPITWPVVGSVRFSFGSNISVIWNGLIWMWNG